MTMRYLMTFEGHSFPRSAIEITDFISKFAINKFRWWLSRRGPANWSDTFELDPKSDGVVVTTDFPIEKVLISMSISVVKWRKRNYDYQGKNVLSSVSAGFYSFGDAGSPDEYAGTKHEFSRYVDGKISPHISLHIHCDRSVIETEKIIDEIPDIVKHEFYHVFQQYKVRSKFGKNDSYLRRTPVPRTYVELMEDYQDAPEFRELLHTCYVLSFGEEFGANISEISGDELSKRTSDIIDSIRRISGQEFESYFNKIEEEVHTLYPDDEWGEISKELLKEYLDDCDSGGVAPLRWVVKMWSQDFKGFVKISYDLLKNRGQEFIKKANKVKYSYRK